MLDDFTVFKEEVKSRADIVDVIGEFVDLKRRGSSWVGLCPFHTEKTPSFTVNREGQFYHCFGCGKGGDVISFLMDITGMSFLEAMEQLAERTGLQMPERRAADTARKDETDRITAANLSAAEYFHRTLYTDQGKTGMDYLLNRGLTPETIRAFRLGYAPSDSAGLLAFAHGKYVGHDALTAAGIIMQSSYGNEPYSRFGGRVIFPIIDQTARILGFGARLIEGEGAKYINSPETVVYHKSRVLYGIYQAKASLKHERTAIVVEGYMDVISLHQAGITNVIAASGTAFTVEQARILSRMARKVILLFDGDRAGVTAAARGADNLLVTDLDIGVVVLPEGHDPDSFVRESGADVLRALVNNPMDLWEFKLQALKKESVDVNEITRLAGEVADSISLIEDELKRDVYIRDMSLKLGVDIDAMRRAVNGRIRKRKKGIDTESSSNEVISAPQRDLIASIIQFPGLARHFMEEAGTKPFSHRVIKMVVDELFHRIVEGLDTSPSALLSALNDRKAQELIASAAVASMDEHRASKIIEDNLMRFRELELKNELEEIRLSIINETDKKKKAELIKHERELNERLQALKKSMTR